jgi:hypothetical protein
VAGVWPLRIPRTSLLPTSYGPTDVERVPWSFLLIVRTGRVVTHPEVSTAGYTGFPAYSQLHSDPSPDRGAVVSP